MATKTTKVKSTAPFLDGGKTKMFGKQGAHTSKPGVISHSMNGVGGKEAVGGGGHMAPLQGANPSKPGQVSVSTAGKGAKFAAGGTTKMFGFTGSKPARPA